MGAQWRGGQASRALARCVRSGIEWRWRVGPRRPTMVVEVDALS
jgi:hypothetical protein